MGALTGVKAVINAALGGDEESSVDGGGAANCLSELQGRMVMRHRGGFFCEVDKGRSYEEAGLVVDRRVFAWKALPIIELIDDAAEIGVGCAKSA